MITGKKDHKFGLIGKKLSHSFSPQIHAALADYAYGLYEIGEDGLEDFVKSGSLDGFNVTIPYKKAVIPYLDIISSEAERIGAVNTVVRLPDGRLLGDNTDYYGFSHLVHTSKIEIAGKNVMILGTGGASLTACTVCTDMGAKNVTRISRSGEINYKNVYDRCADAEIVVNCTPVGMYPNNLESPICLDRLKNCVGVIDVVYNPVRTKLLLDAIRLGIPCINGLSMLVAQAKRACELFCGESIADTETDIITGSLAARSENVVLVGMPGCGKSTVARELARLMGRQVIDTDAIIEYNEGRSIPEIFEHDGEEYFRRAETDAAILAGKQVGKIVATGGGIVTRAENHDPLRQNGVIVFIERKLDSLARDGRPLSLSGDLEKMYEYRLPLYRAFCDIEVSNNGTPDECAEQIIKILERN